jgi:hypothetical protein
MSSLATACAAVVFFANLFLATAILPNCDYHTNIAALNKAASDSSAGKAGGSEIVTIYNTKEMSRSKIDLRCTGTARLIDSTTVQINYRFFIKDGRLLSEAHLQ